MSQLFIHLRVHSDYSLLQGMIKVDTLVNLCVQHNMPAVALTDSGNLFGSLEFSDYAMRTGVQPIIGCNVMVEDSGENIGNILLLAKNNEGYSNLVHLISNSFKNNQCSKINRVNIKQLLNLCNGLIALTGGHDDILSQLLLEKSGNFGILNDLISAFDDNIYIELQRHNLEHQKKLEKLFIDFAYEKNIPLVATNDVFFANREDFQAHDILSCIADGVYLVQEDRKKLTPDYYFKSSKEMYELFYDIPEAVHNTVIIAQRCSFALEVRKPMLPHFPCADGRTEAEELTSKSIDGLNFRLCGKNFTQEQKKQYYDRLMYELDVVISMDYSGYFLIVADFICWSKKNNILVGPGRGSGVGSLVAWVLQITELDPIEFGLIFERFLNPDRISIPDFDVDFCQEKRDQVIEYVRQKYGYVAHIITFGKLQAKAVLRDVGRVMQIPYAHIDRICKMIPHNPVSPVTLSEAIEMDKNLQKERDDDQTVAKLLEISLKLEGLHRHASVHAAGIVICDQELENLVPLYYDKSCSLPITQYNMKYIEKAGLVKFDFLGLRTLTVIDQICNLIKTRGSEIDISNIPLDDKKTYEMLSLGNSIGVFQLEGSGMREAISKLKPDGIRDIIAIISLYRPGPMDNIALYIQRKHGLEKPDYIHPMLEVVLKETFGVIIYQEQVMEIARILANYTLGSADLLRRAMGKKIKEEMDSQRIIFINGAISNGIEAEKASYIFDLVAKFAGYGFNKSHAAAYALISFQTAYLKANYTLEFFVASMNLDINNKDKLEMLCQQAKLHGINILPPDINSSDVFFSIEGKSIRYGIGALKNVGQLAAKEIIPQTKYENIWHFIDNIQSNVAHKRMLISIIQSGALDSIHSNRRQLFESLEILLNVIGSNKRSVNFDQFILFSNSSINKLIEVEDWTDEEKINQEFYAIGFYLRYHPMSNYEGILEKFGIHFIGKFKGDSIYNVKKVAGIISNVHIKSTNKEKFAVIRLSDPYNINEVAFYNRSVIEKNRDLFNGGVSVIIDMEYHISKNRLIGKNIFDFKEYLTVATKNMKSIVIHVNDDIVPQSLSYLLKDHGNTKVFIKLHLAHSEIMIELPELFVITPAIFIEVLNFTWVSSITINDEI
ncbi:DNA polymerase III subunit alpha [Neoehrlichia mikurensis]|uniref:DNA polymerase III subunit alpha n=1 Tax=Neoehrlichia mikurensis TaxID=89586 RepID=A0A9Q9BS67_9RICK|nr:DNA polymerase III subunit alpha [Neoehrlichia mikurensis]QXK92149.1 DNA polymerase III subunit alpha [Neoehrlichia mikurensis]QXK93843.1 DNA polymerase III subunit alpha [Neoehrlichia mikurensis]UTO55162.1 DNA polymerase III subunit alpha [Neoehrlichia mikurensis]